MSFSGARAGSTRAVRGFVVCLLLEGCVAMGWQLGPGFSSSDTALFSKPPIIEHRDAAYLLVWTQGTYPYFFQPSYEVMDGRLVFALAASSSSGQLAGRKRELKIEGSANIQALEHSGAYWWERTPEPAGRLVRLAIVER
ncbi:MAG: hypothetical protein HY791_23735 [Deltaproteobacteria bacterium]|nr:hypothetical protein [Deltaproteobacteria bacterium]